MFHNYKYHDIQFGFIVLTPTDNERALKATCRNIKGNYPKSPLIAVVPESIKKDQLEKIVPSVVAKDTYASLINEGMKRTQAEWNFIVFSGTGIKHRFAHKYCYFTENEKDILFPIINGQYSFVEGSLNGMLIHKRAFEMAGELSEKYQNLEAVKLLWYLKAVQKGCIFKAIAGVRMG